MKLISYRLRDLLRKKPIFVYLIPPPVFFCFGAALEFAMIKWRPNGINFYDTYKKNRAKEIADDRLSRANSSAEKGSPK